MRAAGVKHRIGAVPNLIKAVIAIGNRMIKDTIRTSKTINAMSDFQFRLWVYLITYVDDYGRGSADEELIKGLVFPRRKRVSEKDIGEALAGLAGMGCINLYHVDGESYFYFPKWSDHQRIQSKKSKFPEPTPEKAGPPYFTVTHGDSPPETKPNQVETETETETNPSWDADIAFGQFWTQYPRKVQKTLALKSWKKEVGGETEFVHLMAVLEEFKKSRDWTKDGGQFIPYPATWINQRRWEDESIAAEESEGGTTWETVTIP